MKLKVTVELELDVDNNEHIDEAKYQEEIQNNYVQSKQNIIDQLEEEWTKVNIIKFEFTRESI